MNLLLEDPRFQKVCSTTTRDRREGEQDGDQYFFIAFDEFEELKRQNLFVECACVHGKHRYGTRSDFLQEGLNSGLYPIKNIDPIGMKMLQDKQDLGFDYCSIFLDVSDDIVRQRILYRQPDIDPKELLARVKSAQTEREILKELYAHVVDASQTIEQVLSDVKKAIF